ncbi:MAG: LysM peptidoglycan-binding domain-containing protein [Rhodobacteraceae bacterium]|nr:LysM peptidoglycan-binding domain-containing protein [Paracoccaceae bacterium]
MKRVENPYDKIWSREEIHFSKVMSQEMTKHLRSASVQKLVDKEFKTSDSASQIDWKTKDISKATKVYRRAVDRKLKATCRGYPGLMTYSEIKMSMVKSRFLPSVEVIAQYAKQMKGGKVHYVVIGDTLRSVSKKYYGNDIYWDVIEKANPKSWVEGAALDIPLMLVPDDTSKSAASCAAGGNHMPSRIAYPEVTVDLSKTIIEQRMIVPCKGLPFTIYLTFKATGTLNAGKTGTIPVSFKLNDFSSTATKTVQGLKFTASAKSAKMTDLAAVSISGTGQKWSFALALEDGHKLTMSAASKPVKFVQNGFAIAGNLGFSITAEVIPSGSGLKVRTPEMAKVIMVSAFSAAATLVMFAALRGMSPSMASGMLINQAPPSGAIGYEESFRGI